MLALAGIVVRTWRDVGQAQGLASAGGSVDLGGTQGRHKACSYRSGEGEGGGGRWARDSMWGVDTVG